MPGSNPSAKAATARAGYPRAACVQDRIVGRMPAAWTVFTCSMLSSKGGMATGPPDAVLCSLAVCKAFGSSVAACRARNGSNGLEAACAAAAPGVAERNRTFHLAH
jgi:hypothetical protein